MRAKYFQVRWCVAFIRAGIAILGVAALAIGQTAAGENATSEDFASLVGYWTGESSCQVQPSACHNEKVLYRIAKSSDNSTSAVKVSAYKIVDGREVLMGSGNWTYDKDKGILVWEGPVGVWKLTIHGNKMEGTLTLADKTVFRRMTLKKEE